jgi:6-pyruvoyltetrahydropterin/6-carboxytetrahydropterin synthase
MLVTKCLEIDMGHRVPNHKSKCKNLHGHRYKIEVGVDDKVVTTKGKSNEGMVIDFGDLKDIMVKHIDNVFDHGLVLYDCDILSPLFEDFDLKIVFVPFIPTAENLAKEWYEILEAELQLKKIKIKYVKVWETPTSTATYEK